MKRKREREVLIHTRKRERERTHTPPIHRSRLYSSFASPRRHVAARTPLRHENHPLRFFFFASSLDSRFTFSNSFSNSSNSVRRCNNCALSARQHEAMTTLARPCFCRRKREKIVGVGVADMRVLLRSTYSQRRQRSHFWASCHILYETLNIESERRRRRRRRRRREVRKALSTRGRERERER